MGLTISFSWNKENRELKKKEKELEQRVAEEASNQDTILERKRTEFIQGVDYFSGSLNEYEDLKGKRYTLIDMLNKGQPIQIYDPGQFWLCVSQSWFKRDENEQIMKDKRGKKIFTNFYDGVQGRLVDKLIEEKCVGLIRAEYSAGGLFGNRPTFWEGYPVKEK
ncbi:MAG: hypothetical protein WC758_00910 [Candidatus Woesearchaeota archaeon]|jgi:hypothetical protein